MSLLKKLAIGRAIQRGLSISIGLIGTLIMLMVAYYSHVKLTTAKIFSILELTSSLKLSFVLFGLGIGLHH